MVSKKVIASTLAGTKALGVSGALGWALGLFDGEGLENVMEGEIDDVEPELVHESEPLDNVPSVSEDEDLTEPEKQPEVTTHDSQTSPNDDKGIQQGGAASSRDTGISTLRRFFATEGKATDSDRESIEEDTTWGVNWNPGMGSLWVQAEKAKREDGTKFLWRCNVKAVSIEGINPSGKDDYSEFIRQKGILEQALEDKGNKEQFVKNCSEARLDDEKKKGENSEIELEAEQAGSWSKYKFKESEGYFKRVWTEDFVGIYRLSKKDKEIADKKTWSIKEEKEGLEKTGKVAISTTEKEIQWSCSISGTSNKPLDSKTFKDKGGKLKDILDMSSNYSGEIEKKRYLFKNCRKNKMAITGLKIEVNGSNWWFEERSLEKIYEGMYTNPTKT